MYASSENLVKIAGQHQPHSALVTDNLSLPHPSSSFDFAISVAVVHHLSTQSRRVQALAAVLEALRPSPESEQQQVDHINVGGRALIYVWALEQKTSRRGWDEGDQQDVMVPWIMKTPSNDRRNECSKTFSRYYHLYRQGELESDLIQAGGSVVESGHEKDNWWAIAVRRQQVGQSGCDPVGIPTEASTENTTRSFVDRNLAATNLS